MVGLLPDCSRLDRFRSRHASAVAGLCFGSDFDFFRSINAEISVMIRPTGNGSIKVMAALMKGLSKYFN